MRFITAEWQGSDTLPYAESDLVSSSCLKRQKKYILEVLQILGWKLFSPNICGLMKLCTPWFETLS